MICVVTGTLGALAASTAAAQETCGTPVDACRTALFVTEDIVDADNACAAAITADPNDGCARIFRAATRILRVMGEDSDGGDAMTFTDSMKEMLDQFGIGPFERSIYDFSPSLPENLQGEVVLPSDSPNGTDVQDALDGLFVTAITASVADLQTVSASTVVQLTANEIQTVANAIRSAIQTTTIELDFGEAKLFESVLSLWKSQLLLLIALDLDVDIDAYTPIQDAIIIQTQVLDANPDLAILRSGASQALADANQANRDSLAAYFAASSFIRSEVDDQTDDLITIEPDQLADEADVRVHLTALQASLDAPTPILNAGTTFIDESSILDGLNGKLGTSFDSQGVILDLGLFYDIAPFDPRSVLPPFSPSNSIVDGSFPDPTFGRVLVPEPIAPLGHLVALLTVFLVIHRPARRGL